MPTIRAREWILGATLGFAGQYPPVHRRAIK